jgi:hypothetical protein
MVKKFKDSKQKKALPRELDKEGFVFENHHNNA